MADLVLRDLDDALKERLRMRAARNKRSMNAELREIVRDALMRRPAASDFRKLAAEIRALNADRRQTASEDLLREMRRQR